MVDKVENCSTFLKIQSNTLIRVSILMLQFVLKFILLRKFKEFLSAVVSKICFVRFIDVKFYLEAKVSVCFRQVSALECPLYRGHFIRI